MAAELGYAIPVLSDPAREVIYAYSMKAPGTVTADMGYVVIDHSFGDHAGEIVRALERIAAVRPSRP